jgi:PEP-CTERM motif
MLGLRAAVAFSLLLLLAATPAGGALLSLLGSSTLEVRVGELGGARTITVLGSGGGCEFTLPPIVFPVNTPPVLLAATAGGGFVEPAGLFTGTQGRQIPGIIELTTPMGGICEGTPGVLLFEGTTIANLSNGTKSIGPGAAGGGHASGVVRPGGGLGGGGPLAGTFLINVLGLFNLQVPLGAVGSTGATDTLVAGTLAVTVLGTGWTTASAQVTGVTTGDFPSPVANTVTVAGYDNRTPGHVGRVLLVSPFKVITNFAGNLPGIALQTLDFGGVVPEPSTLGLLVAGAAGLAFQGWRKQRR